MTPDATKGYEVAIEVRRDDAGSYELPGAAEAEHWHQVRTEHAPNEPEDMGALEGWGPWERVARIEDEDGGERWYFLGNGWPGTVRYEHVVIVQRGETPTDHSSTPGEVPGPWGGETPLDALRQYAEEAGLDAPPDSVRWWERGDNLWVEDWILTPEQLRDWRESRDLTQGDLARLLGRSGEYAYRTVADWEAGRRPIPPDLHLTLETLDRRLSER